MRVIVDIMGTGEVTQEKKHKTAGRSACKGEGGGGEAPEGRSLRKCSQCPGVKSQGDSLPSGPLAPPGLLGCSEERPHSCLDQSGCCSSLFVLEGRGRC